MVIGKVRMIRIGLTNIFSNPNTIASINAVTKEFICTPLSTYDKPKATTAEMIILRSIFITANLVR
jgi:hypothetical protein